MVLGKIKGIIMNNNVFVSCVTLALVTLIGSATFYQYSELKSVERNVESAIVKGIDPVAVRCAYASQSDVVCVAYASSHQQGIPTPKSTK
jgi:uncharacterized membrane protein